MDNTHSGQEYSDDFSSIEDSNEESTVEDFSVPSILMFSESNMITREEKRELRPRRYRNRDERIDDFINEHRQFNVVDEKIAAMFEERVGQGL